MGSDPADEVSRLKGSERRYRALVEAVSAAQAVWAADPNGELEEDSPSWRKLTGQTYEQFRGRGFLDAIHPDDVARVTEAWQSAIQKRSRYESEYRLRLKDGEYHWFASRGVPIYADDGSVSGWVGTSTDIDDHRTREGATRLLLKAEELFASSLDERTIFQKLAELAVPRLADWCAVDLITANGAVDRIAFEHADPSKRELAMELVRRYPPKDDVAIGIIEAARSGRAQLFAGISDETLTDLTRGAEHREILRRLGIESYMLAPLAVRSSVIGAISLGSASPDRTFGQSDLTLVEELAHRVAVAIDNARLYAEAQNANHAKDLFLAMLSHEMKTPLTAILGWARILKLEEPPEQFREAIDAIEQSALVQQRLIEDLLDVSRVIAGKLHIETTTIDIREVIRRAVETVQPQAKEQSIAIWTQVPEDPMVVSGDATRLQQVIWNLLTNAIKFTPKGGLIEVFALREGDDCVVNVRDTGRGIKPDVLPYLFETFRQSSVADRADHKGLGLGLAIVRSVVQMHGGSVEVASEGEGKGSTFTVRIPASEASGVDDPKPAPRDEP